MLEFFCVHITTPDWALIAVLYRNSYVQYDERRARVQQSCSYHAAWTWINTCRLLSDNYFIVKRQSMPDQVYTAM